MFECALHGDWAHGLTVVFTAPEINITGVGNGSGRVTDTAVSGLSCIITPAGLSGSCSKVFDVSPATQANFVPVPGEGSVFVGYSGLCTGIQACSTSGDFPPNGQLVARFDLAGQEPATATLKIQGAGTGNGVVTVSPGGTQCTISGGGIVDGVSCAVMLPQSTQITLTAEPRFGSTFGRWEGDECANSTALTCTFTLSANRTVAANFISPHSPHDLALALTGTSSSLSADERAQLDRLGNKNGTFDLGDLLAYLDRTKQSLTPTDAAASHEDRAESGHSLTEDAEGPVMRTPFSTRSRPSVVAAILLASVVLGCGGSGDASVTPRHLPRPMRHSRWRSQRRTATTAPCS